MGKGREKRRKLKRQRAGNIAEKRMVDAARTEQPRPEVVDRTVMAVVEAYVKQHGHTVTRLPPQFGMTNAVMVRALYCMGGVA
jgi:hypothetical protein